MARGDRTVQHWLDAADRVRALARWASEHAAATSDESLGARFEEEARLHLAAADCFEQAAVATFETYEIELEITRSVTRALA